MGEDRYVGVDGCRAGWFFVCLGPQDDIAFGVAETIAQVVEKFTDAAAILVDIPIGLPWDLTPHRECDRQARRVLSPLRHNAVFSPPCREVLTASTYSDAQKINREVLGRGLTRQAWHITPGIKDVDEFLRSHPEAVGRLRESHPEVCFRALSGGSAMVHSKKKSAGFEERMAILGRYNKLASGLVKAAQDRYAAKAVARDDIVDALALAVTGQFSGGKLKTIPDPTQKDENGLPMEIVHLSIENAITIEAPPPVIIPLPMASGPMETSGAEDRVCNDDPNCLFCGWIKEGKAVNTLGTVAAFEDGHPVTEGHLLVVPLRHTADFFSMTEQERRDTEDLIDILAENLRTTDPEVTGFNVGINIGESAGQTIFHAHTHLIPRRHGDSENPRGGVRGVIDGKRGY